VAALARYDDELVARRELAEWHTQGNRHARALVHARSLFRLRVAYNPTEDVEDIDEAIIEAYDDAGCFSELLPWLRSHETFPLRVAFRVFVGLTSLEPNPDPELAMRAARETAAGFAERKDTRQVLLWRIREAGVAAKAGDLARLDALVTADVDGDPAGWSEVAQVYLNLDDVGAAAAAADRALVIDSACAEALIVSWQIALQVGDLETLHRVAMALVANHPRLHQGPEMLARSFARRFDAEAALMHSERALAMARYCHNAWTARAEALAVAGDVVGAREHIERSLVMRQHDDDGSDALILAAALRKEYDQLDAEIAKRKAKAPGFAEYYAYLRKLADGLPQR
jgi:tetratricopeptide (TPR) repeat protein